VVNEDGALVQQNGHGLAAVALALLSVISAQWVGKMRFIVYSASFVEDWDSGTFACWVNMPSSSSEQMYPDRDWRGRTEFCCLVSRPQSRSETYQASCGC
jgi:hypothetical protein